MRIQRLVVCLAFVALLAAPSLAATSTSGAPSKTTPAKSQVAPADEYFGHQKISALGIDNMIRDTTTRENYNPESAWRLYGSLAPAEDALEDWAHKYPHDSWIPKRAYLLSHLFWRMHTADANAAANRCRIVLFHYFPHNHYANLARHERAAQYAPQAAATPAAQAANN